MQDIITFDEITKHEGIRLQKGINIHPKGSSHSILLMSVRKNSPYNDGFDKDGKLLYYEGEDINRREKLTPKKVDQPLFSKSGLLSSNGKMFKFAEDFRYGRRENPEKVHVYEKIADNVWSPKGTFDLVDVKYIYSKEEKRQVFKFVLKPLGSGINRKIEYEFEFSRRIPTKVKQIVWDRDKGQCVDCGSKKDLHFDHIIPWSKGGSSTSPENVQILCSKHNLEKTNKII